MPLKSSLGYLWLPIIYTGRNAIFESTQTSGDTSKTSVTVLSHVGSGDTLWMDNFYSASALAQKLQSMKTDCVVTLHLYRKDVPKIVSKTKH
jgi:hypothetical protein